MRRLSVVLLLFLSVVLLGMAIGQTPSPARLGGVAYAAAPSFTGSRSSPVYQSQASPAAALLTAYRKKHSTSTTTATTAPNPSTTTTALVTTTQPPSTQSTTTTTSRSSFDLRAAINACPAGGTVTIPTGTWTITSPLILKSGISIVGQAGARLYMPYASSIGDFLVGKDVQNVLLKGFTLTTDQPGTTTAQGVIGIHLTRHANVTVEDVLMENMTYGIKADTQGAKLTVRRLRTTGGRTGIYASYVTGLVLQDLDLASTSAPYSGSAPHQIYLSYNTSAVRASGVRLSGGNSYCLQGYPNVTDVIIDNLTMDGTAGGVSVADGCADWTFTNVKGLALIKDYAWFDFQHNDIDCGGVTVDGFEVHGHSLAGSNGAQPVGGSLSFRNGSCYGITPDGVDHALLKSINLETVTYS